MLLPSCSFRTPWRLLLLSTTFAAAVVGVCVIQPLWAFDVLARLFPGIVWRVQTRQPLVALSFDDGPDPRQTPRVLEALSRHRARATFFLIGERAAAQPELVARIRREGHEIANHYDTDRSTLRHDAKTFEAHLTRAESGLGLADARPKLFRPPGGLAWPSQLAIARQRGYTCVLGSAYPYDPRRPPTAYIRWLVGKNLAPGVIVILHDAGGDRSNTIAALPGILEAGRNKGLRFVTVGELLRAADEGASNDPKAPVAAAFRPLPSRCCCACPRGKDAKGRHPRAPYCVGGPIRSAEKWDEASLDT